MFTSVLPECPVPFISHFLKIIFCFLIPNAILILSDNDQQHMTLVYRYFWKVDWLLVSKLQTYGIDITTWELVRQNLSPYSGPLDSESVFYKIATWSAYTLNFHSPWVIIGWWSQYLTLYSPQILRVKFWHLKKW